MKNLTPLVTAARQAARKTTQMEKTGSLLNGNDHKKTKPACKAAKAP